MLRLHFAGPNGHAFASKLHALAPTDGAILTGTSHTAATNVEAMRSTDIDALVFPVDWSHLVRTLRASATEPTSTPLIAVSTNDSTASLVHALAFGFDGAISADGPIADSMDRISRILDGTWTFESEPVLRSLGVTRGLLARQLILDDADDHHLADLVGTGLPDDDIALVMDWTIQQVRNRIERLLADNDLAYRTQLAVIRAASLKVPDFS